MTGDLMPLSAVGQASGQNPARTVQADHLPAVAGSPLAMMAQTPEPIAEENTKLKEKLEEMKASMEATEQLWLAEMERAHKAENDLEAALIELKREKEENSRLKRRLCEHLKTADADARPPRGGRDRSRSPLVQTARSATPEVKTESSLPEAQIDRQPQQPSQQNDVLPVEAQAPQHEAPGPLRRMPKCRRRCCYQPPAPQVVPRPPRRSREVEKLGPIIEDVVFEDRPRRSRQPPARLVVNMARRSYAAIRNSLMPKFALNAILQNQFKS
uniref:Uncharacterized protein n=1 Tax=Bursaphelenchus xylophilus TaxID=6326 RepID=A0A1I7SE67_BURXY